MQHIYLKSLKTKVLSHLNSQGFNPSLRSENDAYTLPALRVIDRLITRMFAFVKNIFWAHGSSRDLNTAHSLWVKIVSTKVVAALLCFTDVLRK